MQVLLSERLAGRDDNYDHNIVDIDAMASDKAIADKFLNDRAYVRPADEFFDDNEGGDQEEDDDDYPRALESSRSAMNITDLRNTDKQRQVIFEERQGSDAG